MSVPRYSLVLRQARAASGRSLEWLARHVGLSRNYLHDLETGRTRAPASPVVCRIASALDAPLTDHLASALHERQKVELILTDQTHALGVALAEQWGELTPEQITALMGALDERQPQ